MADGKRNEHSPKIEARSFFENSAGHKNRRRGPMRRGVDPASRNIVLPVFFGLSRGGNKRSPNSGTPMPSVCYFHGAPNVGRGSRPLESDGGTRIGPNPGRGRRFTSDGITPYPGMGPVSILTAEQTKTIKADTKLDATRLRKTWCCESPLKRIRRIGSRQKVLVARRSHIL